MPIRLQQDQAGNRYPGESNRGVSEIRRFGSYRSQRPKRLAREEAESCCLACDPKKTLPDGLTINFADQSHPVDTENPVRIENAGSRSVRGINLICKFSRGNTA